MKATVNNVVNGVLFQLCWYTAIFWTDYWFLVPFALLVVHFILSAEVRAQEMVLAAIVIGAGWSFDSLVAMLGGYQFPGEGMERQIIPLWLTVIWCAFALTITRSLFWLTAYPRAWVAAMAIAGPFSYWVGKSSGAINFSIELLAFLSIFWGILGMLVLAYRSLVNFELQRSEV